MPSTIDIAAFKLLWQEIMEPHIRYQTALGVDESTARLEALAFFSDFIYRNYGLRAEEITLDQAK